MCFSSSQFIILKVSNCFIGSIDRINTDFIFGKWVSTISLILHRIFDCIGRRYEFDSCNVVM
jgi:hypothetical protein